MGSGGPLGLLFQPRWSGDRPERSAGAPIGGHRHDRTTVMLTALEAVVLGDTTRFDELFTDDVVFAGPHVTVTSLPGLRRALGSPEDALSSPEIVVLGVDAIADKVVVEWRLDACFSGPVLFDDRLLIEPTGETVHLRGVSIAEFDGSRISCFRHYFDDTELFDGVPGTPSHLRWSRDR